MGTGTITGGLSTGTRATWMRSELEETSLSQTGAHWLMEA